MALGPGGLALIFTLEARFCKRTLNQYIHTFDTKIEYVSPTLGIDCGYKSDPIQDSKFWSHSAELVSSMSRILEENLQFK